MLHAAELYVLEKDEQAREQGNVYIEDLALSGVVLALGVNGWSKPSERQNRNKAAEFLGELTRPEALLRDVHIDVSKRIGRAIELGDSGSHVPSRIPELEVLRTGGEHKTLSVNVDTWDKRPINARFIAGQTLNPSRLTGFLPFDPEGYDGRYGRNAAQATVDSLRLTGDPCLPLYFDGSEYYIGTRTRASKSIQDLAVCSTPYCRSDMVYPIDWENTKRGGALATLRCPNCECVTTHEASEEQIEAFDAFLDRGTDSTVRDLRNLTYANMATEINTFVGALDGNHILPEDF